MSQTLSNSAVVGEPEVLEEGRPLEESAAWRSIKTAVAEIRPLQVQDGSIPLAKDRTKAKALASTIADGLDTFAKLLPHDALYLTTCATDFRNWAAAGFAVPDFLDSLNAFQPQLHRVDGLPHLVVFPMYTQNGSSDRLVEAVLIEVRWPDFVGSLEAGEYSNKLFVPIRFLDFTDGYDTNSAVLFPETVAMREIPTFTWGAIFADREAARFRRVVRAASEITKLDLPDSAARLLEDQQLAEETFVMWDLIHDRTHMRGDLPFDPFMIKQRMPFFLYSLEELRCDLTAFREATKIFRNPETDENLRDHADMVQYAIIFDRIFRFPLTGSRVRNYDGLGGQLLFAWLHQHHVLNWTDTQLTIDWDDVPDVVIALSDRINDLYWRSIDRPKIAHWLAAYDMIAKTLAPNPASRWAARDLPLEGPAKLLTDAVMDDEFPLSMFYEALSKKMTGVIESTSGITAKTPA